MKIIYRTIGVAIVVLPLVLTTGCVNPDGTQNNTGMGAIIGGGLGAAFGAVADRAHPGTGALIGAGVGALVGAIAGHITDQINAQQRAQLQEQSPQTLQTIRHNDYVYQQQHPSSQQPSYPQIPSAQTPPQTTETTPLTVDDIKALSAAGVKPDVIKEEIGESKAVYHPEDIAAAQQASVDPSVIECMKNHTS